VQPSNTAEPVFTYETNWPPLSDAEDAPPWRVGLVFTPIDGRIECTRFAMWMDESAAGKPVTASALHNVPLGSLINWVVPQARAAVEASPELAHVAKRLPKAPNPPRGRPPVYDLEHWKKVAATYRKAAGRKPTQAVADAFHVERSTAAGWVRRCRALELLGPTDERRPGERAPVAKKGKKR
jgi:hypothetical protein